uniref:Uncharacterized protein n=1 Tax=Anopheles christyi TaxID=43041 RepID=A0A182KI95_9DIPT
MAISQDEFLIGFPTFCLLKDIEDQRNRFNGEQFLEMKKQTAKESGSLVQGAGAPSSLSDVVIDGEQQPPPPPNSSEGAGTEDNNANGGSSSSSSVIVSAAAQQMEKIGA